MHQFTVDMDSEESPSSPTSAPPLRRSVELLCLLLLAAAFVANVWDYFDKYLAGETTNFIKTSPDPDLKFPGIVLCPEVGYRFGKMRGELNASANHFLLDSLVFTDDHAVEEDEWTNKTLNETEGLFLRSTYSAAEMIRDVVYYDASVQGHQAWGKN